MEEKCEPVEVVYKRKGSFPSYLKGLFVGGLIGASIAMLSTPRTGEETRMILRAKGNELRDRATDTAEEARKRAEDLARTGVDKANDLKERSQSFINTQKGTLQSTAVGVKEGVKTYREQSTSDMGSSSTESPLAPAPDSDLTSTAGY
jgi:gas vesicle protein